MLLGDPRWRHRSGATCELRFGSQDSEVAVVYGDLISKWNVQTGDTGTTLMTATLMGEGRQGFGLLPSSGVISFWVDTPRTGRVRLGFGTIDYWNHEFDASGETVEVHARGVLAPLIDTRFRKAFEGELKQLLKEACAVPCGLRIEGLEKRHVRAYINAPSIYGGLRLLGVSLGFVIEEHPHEASVSILSEKRALEEFLSKPINVIGESDLVSGNVRRGAPVKKRDE